MNYKSTLKLVIFLGSLFILGACTDFDEIPNAQRHGNGENSSCFIEHEGLTGYGQIKTKAFENSLGLIQMFFKGDEHIAGCFLYKYNENQTNFKIDTTVSFNVKSLDEVSFAINVKLVKDTAVNYMHYDTISSLAKIKHIGFKHRINPSHRYGHLQRISNSRTLEINSEKYTLGEFTQTNRKMDTLWVPLAFDLDTCTANPDSIWLYINDNFLSIDSMEVILEIGCTHQEFHLKQENNGN